MLDEFIVVNRDEIIRRCRAKVAARSVPPPTEAELDHGVPVFLDQLRDALRFGQTTSPEISRSAIRHGHDLLRQGFTVPQVVHDYGDICQALTELAVELNAPISTTDFRTLNRCLDDAIAGAVTEYGRERMQSSIDGESARGSERLSFFAHELRGLDERSDPGVRGTQDGERWCRREYRYRAPSQPHGSTRTHQSFPRRGPPHTGDSEPRAIPPRRIHRRNRNSLNIGRECPWRPSDCHAEANDGRIYARNLPGRGCAFTVDLPRLPVPAVAGVPS